MPPTPATCPRCHLAVLRVLVAGERGDDRLAVLVDPQPGGPRPRYDVARERWVPRHQRGSRDDLHTRHSWTCPEGHR